jgi:hypothetical protein
MLVLGHRSARRRAGLALSRWGVLRAALGAWALAGCTQVLGIEDTSVAPPPSPPDDDLVCADATVASSLEPVPINTETAVDDFTPRCGQAGARDQAFGFTAPVTDYYTFDTFGARFDTVLAMYDRCGGAELACNNNAGALPQSEIVRRLEEGEKALLVVEGFNNDSGTGSLKVARVTCPDADLQGVTLPASFTTVSFGDELSSPCGGAGREDRAYHWVAPRDGLFGFKVSATSFTPTISLLDGPRCQDAALGCNAAAPTLGHSEVVRRLRAGQPVSLVVDGVDGAGAVSIDITERDATCPQSTLVFGAAGQMVGPRTLAPSCGAVEVGGPFGGRFDMGDKVYAFTVPAPSSPDCFESCFLSLTSGEPMILYALEGNTCAGKETLCKPTTFNATSGKHVVSTFLEGVDHKATPFTVVVADATSDGNGGPFDLGVSCAMACP